MWEGQLYMDFRLSHNCGEARQNRAEVQKSPQKRAHEASEQLVKMYDETLIQDCKVPPESSTWGWK